MTSTASPPEPYVPAEVDLRDFEWYELDVRRLMQSPLNDLENAEAFRMAVRTWCIAWHETPAGSLPSEEATLCRLLGWGKDLRAFRKVVAAGGLRGWVQCSDGRLYHRVVAEKAITAWQRKLAARRRDRGTRDRVARHRRSSIDREDEAEEPMPNEISGTYVECNALHDAPVTGMKRVTRSRPGPGPWTAPRGADQELDPSAPSPAPPRPRPGTATPPGPEDHDHHHDHTATTTTPGPEDHDTRTAAATQGQARQPGPDSPAAAIGTPARPGTPAMGASEVRRNPLAERTWGIDVTAVRDAVRARDVLSLADRLLATDVPKHEADWRRDTHGLQIGEVTAVMLWALSERDPIRLPSGFRQWRRRWNQLPLADRRGFVAEHFPRWGIAPGVGEP